MALEDLAIRCYSTIFKDQAIELFQQFNFLVLRTSNKIFVNEACEREWDRILRKALSIHNNLLSKGLDKKKPFYYILCAKKKQIVGLVILAIFATSIRMLVLMPTKVINSGQFNLRPRTLINKNHYQYKFTDYYGRLCEDGKLIIKGKPYPPFKDGIYNIPKYMLTYGNSQGYFLIEDEHALHLALPLEENVINHLKIDCPCKSCK